MWWNDRRKNFLISRLQLKLLAGSVVYTAALTLLFVTIVFAPPIATLYADQVDEQEKVAAADRMLYLHKSIWPAVALIAVCYGLLSVITSHRIFGPLYRFQRVFEQVRRGNLRVRAGIRTKDYLQQESDSINDMIDGLAERLQAIEGSSARIRRAVLTVAENHAFGEQAETTRALEELESSVQELEAGIGRFALPAVESAAVADDAPVEREESTIPAV